MTAVDLTDDLFQTGRQLVAATGVRADWPRSFSGIDDTPGVNGQYAKEMHLTSQNAICRGSLTG